jgi:ankyrin repeat protein
MNKRKNTEDNLETSTPPPPPQRRVSLIRLLNHLAHIKLNKQTEQILEQRQQIIQIINQKMFYPNETINKTTPLMLSIYIHETSIAIELIKSGLSSPEETNDKGQTALILACKGLFKNIVDELIKTNNYNPSQVDYQGDTALMLACENSYKDTATQIIQGGNFKPEQVNETGNTALIYACQHGLRSVALELIKTGQSNPGQVNADGVTALVYACSVGLNDVAIELIRTGQSNSDYIDTGGWTALMYCCENAYSDIALELIHSGHSYPDYVSITGDTALILACANSLKDVVLALIQTGHSSPGTVNGIGYTALMYAISKNMPDIALELIHSGQSNPKQINDKGISALSLAESINMTNVVNALLPLFKETNFIDINQEGFNTILQETIIVKDYLHSNIDNLCFMVNNKYYLTSISDLRKQLVDENYTKYGCAKAGENNYDETTQQIVGMDYTGDENINYDIVYFSMSSILGLQILVLKNEIETIIQNKYSSNLYSIEPTGIKLSSIISLGFINGAAGASADHCQTGKETDVYSIKRASVLCNQTNSSTTNVTNVRQQLTNNNINVQYKGNVYVFPISINTTIGDIKLMLLNKLIDNRDPLVNSLNFNVKFIYTGKIYVQEDVKLTTLVNPPFGITLQAMISPKSGGKKTKKLKYKKRRNTCKKRKVCKK